jgi:ribosomal protein S18 acetylase RimI-like enzyme
VTPVAREPYPSPRVNDPTDPIVVRPAERADLRAISALAAKLVRMHHAFDRARFMLQEPLEAGYEGFFASEVRDRDAVILAATLGEVIVGYAYGRLEPRDWNALRDACGALHDIYVDEAVRRRGLARRLVDDMITRLAALGAPRVALGVAWQNAAAQRFFESIGFRKTMIEMTREIDPTG